MAAVEQWASCLSGSCNSYCVSTVVILCRLISGVKQYEFVICRCLIKWSLQYSIILLCSASSLSLIIPTLSRGLDNLMLTNRFLLIDNRVV